MLHFAVEKAWEFLTDVTEELAIIAVLGDKNVDAHCALQLSYFKTVKWLNLIVCNHKLFKCNENVWHLVAIGIKAVVALMSLLAQSRYSECQPSHWNSLAFF